MQSKKRVLPKQSSQKDTPPEIPLVGGEHPLKHSSKKASSGYAEHKRNAHARASRSPAKRKIASNRRKGSASKSRLGQKTWRLQAWDAPRPPLPPLAMAFVLGIAIGAMCCAIVPFMASKRQASKEAEQAQIFEAQETNTEKTPQIAKNQAPKSGNLDHNQSAPDAKLPAATKSIPAQKHPAPTKTKNVPPAKELETSPDSETAGGLGAARACLPPAIESAPVKETKTKANPVQVSNTIAPAPNPVSMVGEHCRIIQEPPEKNIDAAEYSDAPKDGTSPFDTAKDAPYAFPQAAKNAALAIVFDDAGEDMPSLKHCLSLPFPVTVAVMPGLPHSRESADAAYAAGAEVLLHQPMQAQNLKINPGPLAVTPQMSAETAASLVTSNMAALGHVAGVNNHEGSLITENTEVMAAIMQAAKSNGAYFLDSRTTSGTQVGMASTITGIPYYERDVFLDNSRDKAAIIEQVRRALAIANNDGAAIMIGHVRNDDALVSTLREIAPSLQETGYIFCTVSKSGALLGQ